MSARSCIICGRPAADDHHLTGRALDPALSLWHCHDHHELAHDDWNTAGVPAKNRQRDDRDEDSPPTVLHALYLRLRRLAMWLGRLAEHGVFTPIAALLAAALARWATSLAQCIAGLDAHLPGWRTVPGVAS